MDFGVPVDLTYLTCSKPVCTAHRHFLTLFAAIPLAVIMFALFASPSVAQTNSTAITGTISDPSKAVVSGAVVTLLPGQGGKSLANISTQQGAYEFRDISPGTYSISVSAPGFASFIQGNVQVAAGQRLRLDISLEIQAEKQEVQVSDQSPTVDVSPANNASTLSVNQTDLDAFSDDPDELQSQLTALAGPGAGPNGAQIYVDGFTVEDQIPPKNSIREIRVDQNPFSPEYDHLGYGRIEIFTKPGTNQFHGKFTADGNDLAFDTRDPFASQEPGYHSILVTGDVSGPLTKKSSFFFDFQNRNVENNGVISAVVLDPSFNQVPFAQTVSAPSSRVVVGPRFDYQLSSTNTLSISYQFWREHDQNQGIGQFALVSQGYNITSLQEIVRANDTQVIGSRIVTETRFQTIHQDYSQTPLSQQPESNVIGAFLGGGSTQGILDYHHHHFELDNDTSISFGKHFIKFGGTLRTVVEPYLSGGNFNGTYTFASLTAYQITQRGLSQGLTQQQISAAGGGPTQFTLTVGTSYTRIFSADAGVYVADDWRLHPNLTLSYGLRFETQNYINDHADWAPRLGLAWGVGGRKGRPPKTVLRAGFGIFYDRFGQALQLEAEALDGVNQTQYVVRNPLFYPATPGVPALLATGAASTVYRLQPGLRAPYVIQSAASVERQISKSLSASLTYLNSQGVHQFISDNINAPLPGTFNPAVPSSGVRPFSTLGNIYEYLSDARFQQKQMIANFNMRAAKNASLFGFYSLNFADSNTAGASSFPDNPYNIAQDYGRAAFDIRNRIVAGGSVSLNMVFLSALLLISNPERHSTSPLARI